MINQKRILAVIPARSGSKGLKNKNYKMLNAHPLFAHPLNALKKSKYIDKIIISTDSKKIIRMSKKYGDFVFFERPKKISTDTSSTFDVLDHALNFFSKKKDIYDYVLCLEPTSPFTTEQDVNFVIKEVVKSHLYDSAVSLSLLEKYHPNFIFSISNKKKIIPFTKGKKYNSRRQQVSSLYCLDGSLYFSNVKSLYKNKGFVSNKTYGYITPKWKSYEIDDALDFEIAKVIANKKKKFSK